MKVTLLTHTPDPERTIAAAARLCYSRRRADELTRDLTEEQIRGVLQTILSSGHESALEHANFTFGISGISRACSHQLVRHRLASYNQQSQRYVEAKDINFVIPPSIAAKGERAINIFKEACAHDMVAYQALINMGIDKEDARYLLPNATPTEIVVTMNVRELRHFFSLRSCERAQWEIREMSNDMLMICKQIAPQLFADAGPECLRRGCPEGMMSCRMPWPTRDERP